MNIHRYDENGNELKPDAPVNPAPKLAAPRPIKDRPPTNGWDALQTLAGVAGTVAILFILCNFASKIWTL